MNDNFGLYAILTNPVRGYEYVTHVLVENEISYIQLRIKDMSDFKILQIAEKLQTIIEQSYTKLIINDFPIVAIDCGADGVHIGQEDLPYSEVRDKVGEDMIVGISTHNPDQTVEACEKKPDYIGIGPIYLTPTKKIPDPVLGIKGMEKMLEKALVPAVCIGGITVELLPEVLKNGAKNFSMVRPICAAYNPGKVVKKILQIYQSEKNDV